MALPGVKTFWAVPHKGKEPKVFRNAASDILNFKQMQKMFNLIDYS